MALSEAQTIGFAKSVLELLRREREALTQGALDVENATAMLDSVLQDTAEANATQEEAKRHQKATTAHLGALRRRLYVLASGFLDMAIASVEKGSPAAKNFQMLRSRITRPDHAETIALEPNPDSTK